MDDFEKMTIKYCFHFSGEKKLTYDFCLDQETANFRPAVHASPPDWAILSRHQCPHCPLQEKDVLYCPVAADISVLAKDWAKIISYDQVKLDVTFNRRIVSSETSAQQALSSLLGLIMATSDCPFTQFFRPMARFHLPLASQEETTFRAVSTFLIAQYYLKKDGEFVTDENLDGLREIYENMEIINCHIAERLRDAMDEDATLNALVLLDCFAKVFPFYVEEVLDHMRTTFEPSLNLLKSSIVKDAGE